VRLLLDTCAFLWMLDDSPALPPRARTLMSEPANELFLSAVSAWEIAIKVKLGKLTVSTDIARIIPKHMQRNSIEPLPITHAHALRAGSLPLHHSDPFDRMLVAQADLEHLTLLTPDRGFAPYGVKTRW